MAENLIDLRRRIGSVKNTQKITRAMKTVSAAKMRRSVMELNRTKPVMDKIQSVMHRVGASVDAEANPFMQVRDTGNTILVAVGADKGLCGAFNSHLIEKTEARYRQITEETGDNPLLITLGNRVYNHFAKRDYPIHKDFKGVMSRLKYADALDLSKNLQDLYLKPEEDIKTVEFVFTEYISASKQEVQSEALFPIRGEWGEEEETGDAADIEYIFEPSKEEIFEFLLPKYINSLVYQLLLQSSSSEHIARMVAMELATQAAGDMIDSLTLTMNKMRQAAITKELLEIITATEALAN